MKIPIIFFSISKNSNQQQTNTQKLTKLTMSLESIIKLMSELDLNKKDYREIIKVATEKKKEAPNKTGTTTRKKKDPNAPKRGKDVFHVLVCGLPQGTPRRRQVLGKSSRSHLVRDG